MKGVNVCFLFSLILPLSIVIASPFPQTSDQDLELSENKATEPSSAERYLQVSQNPDEQPQTETEVATGSSGDEPLTSDEIDFVADSNTVDPNTVDSTQSAGSLGNDKNLLNLASTEGIQIAQATGDGGVLDQQDMRCPRGTLAVCANEELSQPKPG